MKYLVGILIVIIIALVGTVAYLTGKNGLSPSVKTAQSETATPSGTVAADPSLTPAITATPTVKPTKKVSGGGILSFPKYELTVPAAWTFTRQSENQDSEQIILSGDGFTITITQGGFGGAMCLFPGDADFEGPSSRYDYFKEIKTQSDDTLRRVWSEGAFTGYGMCQLTQYGWGAPTNYGHISIKSNAAPTGAQVTTLDAVLSSITKK